MNHETTDVQLPQPAQQERIEKYIQLKRIADQLEALNANMGTLIRELKDIEMGMKRI